MHTYLELIKFSAVFLNNLKTDEEVFDFHCSNISP